jgi:hypothetical protein
MALTLFEAAKMATRPLFVGFAKEVMTVDETFGMLPFVDCPGDAHRYTREKAIASAEFVDPNTASITESSSTWDDVIAPVRTILADVDVNNLAAAAQSGQNNQTAMQLMQKGKAVGRKLSQKAISGGYITGHTLGLATDPFTALASYTYGPHMDSDRFGPGSIKYVHATATWSFRAPGDVAYGAGVVVAAGVSTVTLPSDNPSRYIRATITAATATQNGESSIVFTTTTYEPEGLNRLITTAQTITSTGADGDAFGFATLDRLISKVKVGSNRAFVMPSELIEKFFAINRALGGAAPREMALPGYSGMVPSYRGIPILKNEWIPTTEAKGAATTLSSCYLVAFDANDGFYAFAVGANGQAVAESDPTKRAVMGFMLEFVGTREAKDSKQWRAKFYGGFALKSTLAAARASQIITA